MKSEILHTSYVINFLDVDFNSNKIGDLLKKETDLTLNQVNIESLKDWTIQFNTVYGNKSAIMIYKGMPSYKGEKQKMITIHIPVPTKDIVEWGVDPSQYIKIGRVQDEKGFIKIDVNFKNYAGREDYIIDCLRRAINISFQEGFTVNGVKVKAKSA